MNEWICWLLPTVAPSWCSDPVAWASSLPARLCLLWTDTLPPGMLFEQWRGKNNSAPRKEGFSEPKEIPPWSPLPPLWIGEEIKVSKVRRSILFTALVLIYQDTDFCWYETRVCSGVCCHLGTWAFQAIANISRLLSLSLSLFLNQGYSSTSGLNLQLLAFTLYTPLSLPIPDGHSIYTPKPPSPDLRSSS